MLKVGFRMPFIKKLIAAHTSINRAIRHSFDLKTLRSMGWFTNPKRAAHNRIYNRTTKGYGTSIFICLLLFTISACITPAATPIVTEIVDPTQPKIIKETVPPPSPTSKNTSTLEVTATTATNCPSSNAPRQIGAVLDIIDGQSSHVIIDGTTYTVRYLGVISPASSALYATAAKQKNAEYTLSKIVTLISGPIDHDATGTLLRYVFVGDVFVNVELIKQGFVAWERNDNLEASCLGVFMKAAQTALDEEVGLWEVTPTVRVIIKPTSVIKPTAYIKPTSEVIVPVNPPVSNSCCKHCGSTSKPCGDSCISTRYTCHKVGGCACY